MPLTPNKVFVRAESPTAKLWRYMSLPKFLFLLQRKALYFRCLELMARSDPFEGALPQSSLRHRNWNAVQDVPEQFREQMARYEGEELKGRKLSGIDYFKEMADRRIQMIYAFRRKHFINCWHLSEHESAAMWEIYARRDEGIGIVSCEARIEEALKSFDKGIHGGKVIYRDYDLFELEDQNSLAPIVHKRNSFEYEREYRLAFWELQGQTITYPDAMKIVESPLTHGIEIVCDPNALIEKVVVSPLAEDWFHGVVKEAAQKYGLKAAVEKSPLLSDPPR